MAEVSEAFRQAVFDLYRKKREEILRGARAQDPVEFLFMTPDIARIDQYLDISSSLEE